MDQTSPRVVSIDRAIEDFDSKFRFVLLAAGRAEQLIRGARPKVELPVQKPTRLAMEELKRGLVPWGYGPAEATAPEGEGDEAEGADGSGEGAGARDEPH
jgi:DNA-directed RNA polymerase omega subunit